MIAPGRLEEEQVHLLQLERLSRHPKDKGRKSHPLSETGYRRTESR